ncbi:polysaccharide deacetylase family protein [Desulfofundulus thermobenzoicus]|uniref:Polysaccharide deacetylase family protein n=1 Tax=Desulfofundulus thermobenzoicus TaxID=29376 RepID=A0A6N7IM05_9FIRM|nr:polysaccharide deacetylase family protein [Desulfofundulus thermobenzoicus]MQL50995.1 polysaccharide deacetylase family protein [Desulfofundulus thermobenzoicus]
MRKITAGTLGVVLIAILLLVFARYKMNNLLWAPYTDEAVVLVYHHIDPAPDRPFAITPRLFQEHLDALLHHDYHVISTGELAGFLEGKALLPEKAVVITFDDGYRSFYRYAYPELKSREMPATCFMITAWAGKKVGGLEYLTWPEMREMQANGISFFVHTDHSHYCAPTTPEGNPKPVLTNRIWLPGKNRLETEYEYRQRVINDLATARDRLEKELHQPVEQIAWPYGAYNQPLVEIAQSLGYRFCYTTQPGMVTAKTDPFAIPRLDVGNPDVTAQDLLWRIQYTAFKEKLFARPGLRYCDNFYHRFKRMRLSVFDPNVPAH